MSQTKHLERVAIVGASGRIGGAFAEELLKTGKHTVTAITRPESQGTLPEGVKAVQVNYDDEESIVSALKGQEFLIITLSVTAPAEVHTKLVKAAGKAGVPYIMPNVYGLDIENKALCGSHPYAAQALQKLAEVESVGASYVVLVCGYWYEWSLALGEPWFGFEIKKRTVTFFDDGKTRINGSTWPQCGRALAALLSLPESGSSPSLSDWKNKPLYIDSFKFSQRDILDSLHRVLGTTDKDWEITYQPTDERFKEGLEELKQGERRGLAKAMYARVFFPNGDGDYESNRGLANDVLGLKKDDLDESTKRAVEMVEAGWSPFIPQVKF
ncbi:NAD(P)-binding protein [Rhizodiscina lignyota]|uniref:NAD(P)-binding protein n=1 Tax=Rhizodiscina lignyota TaxID=1504668 RepID=A0A9P4I844_9PEZI|nr:NAD(P)-binding protein [Rhizodiscina lignyota]